MNRKPNPEAQADLEVVDGLERVDAGYLAELEAEQEAAVVLAAVAKVLTNQQKVRLECSGKKQKKTEF